MILEKVDINNKPLIKKIIKLIYNTFCECNKSDSSKKLIKRYEILYGKNHNYEYTLGYFKKYSKIFIIAKDGEKIVGVIRGFKSKIINLYIDYKYQGIGIGEQLLEKFEIEAKKLGSDYIILKSSDYAYNFYLKKGYKAKDNKYLIKFL